MSQKQFQRPRDMYFRQKKSDSIICIWFWSLLGVHTKFCNELQSLVGVFLSLQGSQMAHLLSTDLVTWHSDVVKNLYSQFCMHLLSWEGSFKESVLLVIHMEQLVAMGSRNQWKQALSVSCDCMGFAVQKKLYYFFQSWNPRTIYAGQLERTAFVIHLLPSTLEIFSQLLPHNEENICKK